jgi:hypothetical protein
MALQLFKNMENKPNLLPFQPKNKGLTKKRTQTNPIQSQFDLARKSGGKKQLQKQNMDRQEKRVERGTLINF